MWKLQPSSAEAHDGLCEVRKDLPPSPAWSDIVAHLASNGRASEESGQAGANVGKVEKFTSITCQTHGQDDCVPSLVGGKAEKIWKANGFLNAGAESEEEKLQFCQNVGFEGLEYISANPSTIGFFMSGAAAAMRLCSLQSRQAC